MSTLMLLLVVAAGVVAGLMGSLLGLGGGVFLVPFLNAGLGLEFHHASAISLMTVIATSSAVSSGSAGRHIINVRLGMLLEIASTLGGLLAGLTVARLSEHTLDIAFAVVTASIAAMMLTRLDKRNILPADTDPGRLGGRYYEEESGREVVYRIKRLPVGMSAALAAGAISGGFGIGGGILKVPVLNAWCGVPMRAAAATSALMIGVTAVSSVPIQYAHGYVDPPLAAAAVLGVLAGSRTGFILGGKVKAKGLKFLLACILAAVAAVYLHKGLM